MRIHSTAVHAIGSVATIEIPRRAVTNAAAHNAAPVKNAITAASSIIGNTASTIGTSAK